MKKPKKVNEVVVTRWLEKPCEREHDLPWVLFMITFLVLVEISFLSLKRIGELAVQKKQVDVAEIPCLDDHSGAIQDMAEAIKDIDQGRLGHAQTKIWNAMDLLK